MGTTYDGASAAGVAEAAGFNTAITHRPEVVVAATSAADVAEAVTRARRAGSRVAVQATGHGAAAPLEGGVLVSTRAMQGVEVDPAARTARIEAGVRWRAVLDAAAPYGLAPLSGSSSGVGAVGYTLGGGMGHLGRRHGFAADHVRRVELVTADGRLRSVTAEADPDLFWAVRGGQSRFGIVTALEIELFPVPEYVGGALFFTGDAVEQVLRAFPGWSATLPEEVATSVALLRLPPVDAVPPPLRGTVSLALRFGLAGPQGRAASLLAPVRALAEPVLDSVGPMPYAAVDAIHMDPPEPMPAVTRGALLAALPDEAVTALLSVAGPGVETPLAMAELRLMGGALARPAAVPNAVAGREGAWSLMAVAPAPPPLADVAPVVTAGVVAALAPWSPGTSLLNFVGAGDADLAWTPEVRERLERVQREVDPDNTFGGAFRTAVGS
jgi:hypothetical protein